MFLKRVFTSRESRVRCLIPSVRETLHNRTVFGAIGECLKAPVYYIASSTNQKDYKTFLMRVKAALRDVHCRPYLVYDNHPAHKAVSVRNYISQWFRPYPLPCYSPQLNSIETLWGCVKRSFASIRHEHNYRVADQADFERQIRMACQEWADPRVSRFVRANRSDLLEQMQQGVEVEE